MTYTSALAPPEFSTALFAAKHGDAICYFRGHLQRAVQDQHLDRRVRERAREVAADAWDLAARGFGHLLQRRHGQDDYEYLFVRSVKEGA